MKRWFLLSLVLTLALAAFADVKKQDHKKAVTAQRAAATPDKALMQKILDSWSTLDPSLAAPYYSKAPGNVYYDVAPLQYTGWQQYAEGVKKNLAAFKTVKFTLMDPVVHRAANFVWATSTWHGEFAMRDGSQQSGDGRWTVIWEKQGGQWLIVHEHVSEPAQLPAPGPH